jgi:putative ABC transport system permease protein
MAKTLNVTAGDSMTFDISGRLLTVRVANVRRIDVRNARTAFVFVFRPGTLDKAPQSFAATVLKHFPATERQRLQRQVLDKFPNVQIFDVADILDAVNRLVNNFVIAISFVGSFVLLSGILILIGSVALTKSQRIYENAILKTLGANRRTLATILFSEYGLLGAISGLVASAFAVGLSYVVCKYLMEIEWQFDAVVTLLGVVATALLVMAVGVGASFDVLFRKPLTTLRSQ